MCGRLNITDSAGVKALCEQLDIALWPAQGMQFARFVRPTQTVSIVFAQPTASQAHGQPSNVRVMRNAVWWLLLEPDEQPDRLTFKPSRYTSFNTRYDKLNKPGSAGYRAYRQQRCIIPAHGFGETLVRGSQKYYHDLVPEPPTGLAMGGLYRQWQGVDEDGQATIEYSCSVVTLPPHQKLGAVHTKASPLILSTEDDSVQRWLDPTINEPTRLDDLLVPRLRHSYLAQPVDKPSTYQSQGEAFSISKD